MAKIPKRAFIFDSGNVLLRWSPADIVRAALPADADHERYLRGIFGHQRWLDLDRGQLAEVEAAADMAEAIGCSAQEVLRVIRAGQESLLPLAAGVGLLEELHAGGHELIGLTNMSRETFAVVRPRYGFWNLLRGVVVSGEVRMMKPEAAIFEHTLARYGLERERTVFIDDHPANVDAARALGIESVEYDGSDACIAGIRALARS